MPHSSGKIQQVAKRLASREAAAQTAQLEERFQSLALEFQAAQLRFHAAHNYSRTVRQECLWLKQVVNVKQQVIEELLPYYPHPLTPELVYAIELY
jgi:hypothetical protein